MLQAQVRRPLGLMESNAAASRDHDKSKTSNRSKKHQATENPPSNKSQVDVESKKPTIMRHRSNSISDDTTNDRRRYGRHRRRGSIGKSRSELAAQLRGSGGPIIRSKSLVNKERTSKAPPHMKRLDLEAEFMRPTQMEEQLAKLQMERGATQPGLLEYKENINAFRRSSERNFVVTVNYMEMQADINAKMREILIDWLIEVHLKFRLQQETLYLAVQILDRFLARRLISRSKLQLVGCASMLIASKYEEISPPQIREYVYVCDRAYTAQQLLDMEGYILNVLSFNCTIPSALHFANQFIQAYSPNAPKELSSYVYFFLELMLQDYTFVPCLPSLRAATVLYLALAVVTQKKEPQDVWTQNLAVRTQYTLSSIARCAVALYQTITSRPSKYRAIRKKYAQSKFHHVSLGDTSIIALHVSALLQRS